jgi:hypothetical protein
MLARWPENVTLWAAHARLESKRGKLQAARAVYTTILAHHTRVAASIESQTMAMWADWALMEWRAGEQERCTEVLLCLADSRIPGGLDSFRTALTIADGVLEPSHRPRQVSPLSLLKGRQVNSEDSRVRASADVFSSTRLTSCPVTGHDSLCRLCSTIKTAAKTRLASCNRTPKLAMQDLSNKRIHYNF